MTDIRTKLLAAFQVEHKEHVDQIRSLLGRADKEAIPPSDLEEIFRRAHSLRAAARACDFRLVEAIGQRLERIFAHVRKGDLRLEKEIVETIAGVLDAVEDWGIALAVDNAAQEPRRALEVLDRLPIGGLKGDSVPAPAVMPARKPNPSAAPAVASPAGEQGLSARLLAAFQVEHKEHLEGIRIILAEIERGGDTHGGGVDEAFRRAHSLKGAARIADLQPAETLAHRLETVFAGVREDRLRLNGEVIRGIYQGLDAIEDVAACLFEKKPPPDTTPALDAIERILSGTPANGPLFFPATPVLHSAVPEAAHQPAPTVSETETVRVRAVNLDRLLRSAGELLTESQRQDLVASELTGLHREVGEMKREWEAVRKAAAASLRQMADTPALAPIGHYLQLVERRVHSLSRRAHSVHRLQQQCSWGLRVLGGQLQQDVRQVRMVPVESVFQGFRKMMRDLAKSEGKEIDFRVTGFEIEADRMVLQAVKDPLMHVLCNAVSHGIEPPEERIRRGKDPIGRVALHMETASNRLEIRVEDDGRGIDLTRVAEVAVRRGFLSEEAAAAAAPEELARQIFRPGFSTARAVTGLAGRGMGLSVVYEAVTRLQGEVDVQAKEVGTALTFVVPLTGSTQRLLLVSCRGQTFAIPLHAIESLMRVKFKDVETVAGKPMVLMSGQPVPLLGLENLLNLGDAEMSVEGDFIRLMIVRSGPRRLAVTVAAFLDERDALVKPLHGVAGALTTLAGGILLDDGSVALVLNLAELIKTFKPTERAPTLKGPDPKAGKKRSTVLVVDDSLTTRTLEKSILEAQGYEVRIAVDGVEALEQLRGGPLVDLVITDVQMPRLDGFGLLEEMKKDSRLARVPVIVVTSMGKREDQERGLALGADAYIVKRKFDHQDLLATIQQIL